MLVLFLLLILLGGCGLVIGNAILTRFDPSHCIDRRGDQVLISCWIGVLVLANYFLFIALFCALSPPVTVPATMLFLGLALWPQQARLALKELVSSLSAEFLIGTSALALGIAAYCSQVIVWYDSGLYHLQAIKWLSDFGLVPGLALIHSRLGFVSAWFALPAAFNHGMLQGRIAILPGAMCILLMLIQGLMAFGRVVRKGRRSADLFIVVAVLMVLPFLFLWGIPNSPSPDLPVIALTLVVAWALLLIASREKKGGRSDSVGQVKLIPLVLAAGAVTIKLSALPLLAVPACFYLFSPRIGLRKIAVVGWGMALVLVPVAIAGIMTSGCAFYPWSALCIDLPWSLGGGVAEAESVIIRDWARWGGMPAPEYATSWNWILPWLQKEKISSILIFWSLVAAIRLMVVRKKASLAGSGYILALGVSGIVFMMYFAPTWRFGLGYLVLLPALLLVGQAYSHSALLEKLHGTKWLSNFAVIGVTVAIIVAAHVHIVPRPSYALLDEAIARKFVVDEGNAHFNLWRPPPIWNFGSELDEATGQSLIFENFMIFDKVGDITYARPRDLERAECCWDAPLPCSPSKLEKIRFRSDKIEIESGFMKETSE